MRGRWSRDLILRLLRVGAGAYPFIPSGGGGGGGVNTVLHGAGAPAGGLGADGDFYIDVSAWSIYGPKTGGAWGSPTSLIGPAGGSSIAILKWSGVARLSPDGSPVTTFLQDKFYAAEASLGQPYDGCLMPSIIPTGAPGVAIPTADGSQRPYLQVLGLIANWRILGGGDPLPVDGDQLTFKLQIGANLEPNIYASMHTGGPYVGSGGVNVIGNVAEGFDKIVVSVDNTAACRFYVSYVAALKILSAGLP